MHTTTQMLGNGTPFPANGLVVRYQGALILVDTGWGEENTRALLALLDETFPEPVTTVLVSHFHDDSAGGASLMAARGIRVLGSARTRAMGAEVEAIDGLGEGAAVTVGPVELFFPGPAHSQDNLVAWVSDAGVLFGGCAVRSPEYAGLGNTTDGDVTRWADSIRAVVRRYPTARVVVPGHGTPGDAGLLRHTISLFDGTPNSE